MPGIAPDRSPSMRPSDALTLHRAALRQLLNRYGFQQPRVFGSVLTRTDTEESDLDVLVEPVRGTTLFTLAGLEDEARQLTGVRVSVLTPGFLSPKFRSESRITWSTSPTRSNGRSATPGAWRSTAKAMNATRAKAAVLVPARRTSPAPTQTLTAPEFHQLAQVPRAAEWFANIDNPNTRRAYRNDLEEFLTFVGISSPEDLRLVSRAHVLAWRKDLERRELTGGTIRRKLAALSSLFEYLSDANAVTHNPVKGVRRPKVESQEGKTPALGDAQARHLPRLPVGEDLKSRRDRALLSLLLYHGLRREELSVRSAVRALRLTSLHRVAAPTLRYRPPRRFPDET